MIDSDFIQKWVPEIESRLLKIDRSMSKIEYDHYKSGCNCSENGGENMDTIKTYQIDRADLKILENTLTQKIQSVQSEFTNYVLKVNMRVNQLDTKMSQVGF